MKSLSVAFAVVIQASAVCSQAQSFRIAQDENALIIRDRRDRVALAFQKKKPVESALVVESGAFFHPLTTPEGEKVTDLAPDDHPHHRGVFLAFVEMHGEKDADFWGWGEHAPVQDRRIVNRAIGNLEATEESASFTARNEWVADESVMIEEKLDASLNNLAGLRVLDLTYTLTPQGDITLTRWAFSGFCLRLRKDAELLGIFSADGKSDRPNPSHVDPESDWPDAPWYALSLKLEDNRLIGAAVLNHPDNPPTLWHNHRDVRMLNPCIVAPSEIRLEKDKPLRLRYRIATFDGEVPAGRLEALEW